MNRQVLETVGICIVTMYLVFHVTDARRLITGSF